MWECLWSACSAVHAGPGSVDTTGRLTPDPVGNGENSALTSVDAREDSTRKAGHDSRKVSFSIVVSHWLVIRIYWVRSSILCARLGFSIHYLDLLVDTDRFSIFWSAKKIVTNCVEYASDFPSASDMFRLFWAILVWLGWACAPPFLPSPCFWSCVCVCIGHHVCELI